MARAKDHLALIRLADHNFQWPQPEAEYACLHLFKKLTKPSDDSGQESQRTGRTQYTLETAGNFNNVILCAGCKRKSEKCKTRHGSDKLLFVGVRKATPEELKRHPVPPMMGKSAKAGQ